MMRKRRTAAESGVSGTARDGNRNRTSVRQLRYENQEFRELLAKVFRQTSDAKHQLYQFQFSFIG